MWLISLVTVILCSYFLAKMAANIIRLQFEGSMAFVAGGTSMQAMANDENVKKTVDVSAFTPILERNIFDSSYIYNPNAGKEEPADATEGSAEEAVVEDEGGEAKPTTLPIKLISTFSMGKGDDQRSSAIISAGSASKGDAEVYTVNDEKTFSPNTKIYLILNNRVEFLNNGHREYVELEDFTGAAKMATAAPADAGGDATPTRVKESGDREPKITAKGENSFVIDRAELDDAIANLDKLYTQVRAVPHFKDGKPDGLKLLSIKAGSIFSKLGLQRGDVLSRINGNDLDIKKGLEIFNQLKNESKITLDIDRRGSPQTLEYEIR